MPISDHFSGGMTERMVVQIVTVDPSTNRIEGVGKDAAVIQIGLGRVPMVFVWPVQGEYWTIVRENGLWNLESKLAGPDSKSLTSLDPGEAMVQSSTIWTLDGEKIIKTGDAAGGVLSGTYPNPGFAVDMATQAELDAAISSEASARSSADTTEVANRQAGDAATLGVWRSLFECAHAGSSWGSSLLVDSGLNGWQGNSAATSGWRLFQLDSADYALTGYITQIRAILTFACNATAPGISFTAGVLTDTSVAGAANVLTYSGAAYLASGTLTTPSASQFTSLKTSAVTMPAGTANYGLAVTPTGTATTNHRSVLAIHAQMRHVPA